MEVSYIDHKSFIECLWIKTAVVINKTDLLLGICYPPSNQGDEANRTLLQLVKEVSKEQNLLLTGDLNYPDICCENNIAVGKLSIRFLKCIASCYRCWTC